MTRVSVSLVTHNEAGYIDRCLPALFAQQDVQVDITAVDNASKDNTVACLQRYADRIEVIRNSTNRGFAVAHNQAIRRARNDWVLVLNPDVLLEPLFLRTLVEAAADKPRVGSLGGKLLRMAPDGSRPAPPLLDSTGMYFTPTLRHFDRGSNQPDRGQYEKTEYVFGATGAAVLYRRAMIEDIQADEEFFDESFFGYREDADVAWRAQLAGWHCLYVPHAVGYHVRRVVPENRRTLPVWINYHSTKNRFLLRAKNIGWSLFWRTFVPATFRDLGIIAYAVMRERSSLPAFSFLWKERRRIRGKRWQTQAKRRVSDRQLARWFRFAPSSYALKPALLRIAMLGTRGVPAHYGGFETLAEELGARLVKRGHVVTVYGRRGHVRHPLPRYRGMRLKVLPTLPHKYLDTVVHTFLSALRVVPTDAQVVFVCNVANSPFAWIPRVAGKPCVLNVDGLDRQRRKWNAVGRAYLWLCEWLALVTPTEMVTDAEVMQEYYRERYGKRSTVIAYGAEFRRMTSTKALDRLGVRPGGYVLYVSRLEPENNPDLVIRAFEKVRTDLRLVMLGDNIYRPDYVARLKQMSGPRVLFPGGIYGDGYWELQNHAALYVHATEVGGTHPALIEAMSCGHAVVFLNTPENAEVVGDAGLPFEPSPEELAKQLDRLLSDPGLRSQIGARARSRVEEVYNWDRITDQYEELFVNLAGARSQS